MGMPVDSKSALIVVDVQRDFCAGGALAVSEGDQVVPVVNGYIELFRKAGAPVFATRDWHPANHSSFRESKGPWPRHCVQGSSGSEFHPDLRLPRDTVICSKGYEVDRDGYSGFEGTDLVAKLQSKGIRKVFVGGLATDYCVKHTVLDALKEGFEAYLLEDASRGVNVKPGDSKEAINEMTQKGARVIRFEDLGEQCHSSS